MFFMLCGLAEDIFNYLFIYYFFLVISRYFHDCILHVLKIYTYHCIIVVIL